jgi:type II secretory pathway predicted ATPase ExeA
MLCRMLEERLPPSIEIVYLANPNLTARDIVYAIAFELKLEVDSGTDRLLVMQKLQAYLLKKHSEGGSVVVFVEEAQGMPLETLEEIRLLSNLETHRHKLMQIVLFGQPELERKLQNKSIRQLRERITHSFDLDPLSAGDVREYLHFRLQQAGCPWPQLFSPRAEKMIASASGGLTRRINILADKALLAAYADPSMRQEPRNSSGEILPMVLPRHVKSAIEDSGYQRFRLPQLPLWFVYGSTTLAVLVLVAGFVIQGSRLSDAPQTLAAAQALEEAPTQMTDEARTQLPGEAAAPVTTTTSSATTAVVPALATSVDVGATTMRASSETVESAIVEAQSQAAQAPVYMPAMVEAAGAMRAALAETSAAVEPDAVTNNVQEARQEISVSGEPAQIIQPQVAGTPAENAGAMTEAAPVTNQLNSTGLAGRRDAPSAAWVAALSSKQGYAIQLYSISTREPERLEAFLESLELTNMLDRSYICVISANARRPEQSLVMYGDFAGVSEARRFVDALPPYLSQYEPYIRNLNDIACAR